MARTAIDCGRSFEAGDVAWEALKRDVEEASASMTLALKQFSAAERRLFSEGFSGEEEIEPAWYVAAHENFAIACDVLHERYRRVSQTPARSTAAQLFKLELVAALYGVRFKMAEREVDDDVATCVLLSLVRDLRAAGK